MKLALIQMEVKLGDAAYNRQRLSQLAKEATQSGADTLVLPETWNLGFFPIENLSQLAEEEGGESRALLSKLAVQYQVNLVGGSLITKREGNIYNTAYVFDRQGNQLARYDKIHGFSPAGEHHFFSHGTELCTFELDGVKAGLIICYDLRFCELVRSLALMDIQILFVPAQWPVPRVEHWTVLNQARAIENQLYVTCVNGCGQAGDTVFAGNSMVVAPFGEVLTQGGGKEEILYAEADFSILEDIRSNINVMRDRKPHLYRL